jgi:hypothetical protein
VTVNVDLDSPRETAVLMDEVTHVLRGEGFHVLVRSASMLFVTHARISL